MGYKTKIILLVIGGLALLPAISMAAITFTDGYWSTTFNCDDWTQPSALSCDGLEMGDNSAYAAGQGSQINSSGNYSGGGGGKGARIYYEGNTHNSMSSPLQITFPSGQTQIWLRFYYRIPDPQYMGGTPAHKIIYIFNSYCSANVNWPYYSAGLGIEGRSSCVSDIVYDGSNGGDPAYGNWAALYGGNPAAGADGSWHYFEFYFDIGTTSSNGVFRMWVDGVNVVNDTDINLGGGTGATWSYVHVTNNHERFMATGAVAHDIDDIAVAGAAYTGFTTNTTGFATGLSMIGGLGSTPTPSLTGVTGVGISIR